MKKSPSKPTELTPTEESLKSLPEPTKLVTIKGGVYRSHYHVTQVPGPKVEQVRIELITSFLNDLASIQKYLAEELKAVFDQLDAGAEVEPGGLMAEIRESTTAGSATKRLYINGQPVPLIRRF